MSIYSTTISCNRFSYTVRMEHLVDIKLDDLRENTGWLTFSLANQLYTADYKFGWKQSWW